MKANLLLILVCLLAIAACVALLVQGPGDCASAENTWTGMLLVGCPDG
jgi:hypothetical protein